MTRNTYLLIDLDRCWGCRTCEVACKVKFGIGPGPGALRVVDVGPRKIGAALQRDSVLLLCQHCDEPACMEACPDGGLYRGADGSVQLDTAACSRCGVCIQACPYGVLKELADGSPLKCDLCQQARGEGWLPSCAQHCPGRAITMVDAQEMQAAWRSRFAWKTGAVVYVSEKYASLGAGLR